MTMLLRKFRTKPRFTMEEFLNMYKEVHSDESCIEPKGWDKAMKKYDKWGIIDSKGEPEMK